MQFVIETKRVFEEHAKRTYWEATATRLDTGKRYSTRTLERGEYQGVGYPILSAPERAGLPAADPEAVLCKSTTGKEIDDVYGRLVQRPAAADIQSMSLYLFAALIGEEWWTAIHADVPKGEELLEFILRADNQDREITRLPWEMARHPKAGFLAALSSPLVTITREVAGGGHARTTVAPRVLFVIGTEPPGGRGTIQPMTELAGMLRRLDELGVALHARVLLKPRSTDVEREMRDFCPSIVHFLCHGEFDTKGRGSLWLADQDGKPAALGCAQLEPLLRVKQGGMPVVVMSACNSSGIARPVQEAGSLAQELVENGVPLAIGMAGRVQDVACRLFTRQFYVSLLAARDVALATAAGRFAGLTEGKPPAESIDWSMPTLFRQQNLSIKVDRQAIEAANRRRSVATELVSARNPRYFCGRYECWKSFQDLIDGRLSGNAKVLALVAQHRAYRVPRPRHGMTRLAEELAAHLVLSGHLPCMVEIPKDGRSRDHWSLGTQLILTAIDRSWNFVWTLLPAGRQADWIARKNQRDARPDVLGLIQRHMAGKAVILPTAVQRVIDRYGLPANADTSRVPSQVVSAAIRAELVRVLEDAHDVLGDGALKLVVFLDGIERLAAIDQEVLQWFDSHGLSDTPINPIPVVLTYAEKPCPFSGTQNPVTRYMNEHASVFHVLTLDRLPPPEEDWMPYQQFLFSHEPPLMLVSGASKENKDHLLKNLEKSVEGVASRFELPPPDGWHENSDIEVLLDTHKQAATLADAKDREAWDLMKQRWGL